MFRILGILVALVIQANMAIANITLDVAQDSQELLTSSQNYHVEVTCSKNISNLEGFQDRQRKIKIGGRLSAPILRAKT